MNFNQMFTLELALVVLLLVGAIAGALYLASAKRRGGERIDSSEGRSGSTEQRAAADPHEFYMRTSWEKDENIKMRLYSLDEYGREFGGAPQARGAGRFVGALKPYRPIGDEWTDLPPERAARALNLSPEDYEVDGEHGVLLLRKLPHGLPAEARDLL